MVQFGVWYGAERIFYLHNLVKKNYNYCIWFPFECSMCFIVLLTSPKLSLSKKKKKKSPKLFYFKFSLDIKFEIWFQIQYWRVRLFRKKNKKNLYWYFFFQYWIVRSGWLLKSQHIWRHQIQYWVASCKLPNANLVTSACLRWSWSQRGNQRTLRYCFFLLSMPYFLFIV